MIMQCCMLGLVLFFSQLQADQSVAANQSEQDKIIRIAEKHHKVLFEDGTFKMLPHPSKNLFKEPLIVSFLYFTFGALFSFVMTLDGNIKEKVLFLLGAIFCLSASGYMFFLFIDLLRKRLEKDFGKAFFVIDDEGILFTKDFFDRGDFYIKWNDVEHYEYFLVKDDRGDEHFLTFVVQDKRGHMLSEPSFLSHSISVPDDFLAIDVEDLCTVVDFYWQKQK